MIQRSGNRFPAFAKPASAGEGRSDKIMRKHEEPHRRAFLLLTGGSLMGILGLRWFGGDDAVAEAKKTFEIEKPDAEWRKQLTPEQFNVLRAHGTERPGSSPLNAEKRKGNFVCAGCDLPLFSSDTKYESGTGWPSFWQ